MTWAQAMRNAVDFIMDQMPDASYQSANYIAKEILRMGEQLNANVRTRPDQRWRRDRY